MHNLREKLRRQVRAADLSLDRAMAYLREVGSFYVPDHPDLAGEFQLLHCAIEELRKALNRLLEEM